jgi:hypothetical protein
MSRDSHEFIAMAAVRRYLNSHADEAGEIINLSRQRVAVGFTGHGCRHRRGLAEATGRPETDIAVFRALHSAKRIGAIHLALTRALRSEEPADLRAFDLARWGPAANGTEEVRYLADVPSAVVTTRLANLFAGGEISAFQVRRIRRDELPTTA